jgi:hypothetical protein
MSPRTFFLTLTKQPRRGYPRSVLKMPEDAVAVGSWGRWRKHQCCKGGNHSGITLRGSSHHSLSFLNNTKWSISAGCARSSRRHDGLFLRNADKVSLAASPGTSYNALQCVSTLIQKCVMRGRREFIQVHDCLQGPNTFPPLQPLSSRPRLANSNAATDRPERHAG